MSRFFRCTKGAAAAEMALVLPFLLLLLFGSVEVGNIFLSEHVIQKGVRDAARYAARLPLEDLTTGGCSVTTDTTTKDAIKRVARTGDPESSTERLWFWTSNDTVDVNVACAVGAYSTGGVYADFPGGSPVVTVTASVPYTPLFNFLPLASGLTLNSMSQAAVFGA